MITIEQLKQKGISEKDIKFFQEHPDLLEDAVIYDDPAEEKILKLERKLKKDFPVKELVLRAMTLQEIVNFCQNWDNKSPLLAELKALSQKMVEFARKGDYYHVARISLEMKTMAPLK